MRLDCLNPQAQAISLDQRNALLGRHRYYGRMARGIHDWYLRDWLRATHKKQSDIVRDLDWNKARISLMIRGEQQYTRDAVNELSAYLNIHPHELLMHPDEAHSIRRLKAEMIRLAHESLDAGPQKEIDRAVRKVKLGGV